MSPINARTRRWTASSLLLATVAFGLWAARPPRHERPELQRVLAEAAHRAGEGGVVEFASVAGFEWDRVYVFDPYTTDERVREALGFAWQPASPLASWLDLDLTLASDSRALLVFVRDEDEVTGWLVLNSIEDDQPLVFLAIDSSPVALPRDRASFRVYDASAEFPHRPLGAWRLMPLEAGAADGESPTR